MEFHLKTQKTKINFFSRGGPNSVRGTSLKPLTHPLVETELNDQNRRQTHVSGSTEFVYRALNLTSDLLRSD